ncbi:MAG: restriction endonuclease [Candidatus Aenigmatarchaeota archaeon]|nr:restriction endonuclease [Candidatus Aenigmarchaeota archaeon]
MLEELEFQLKRGKAIEDVLEKYDWKKFENVVTEIFKKNGFITKTNFRFKTKRNYEIDIIAVRNNKIFCVDCKWWGRGRYKKTSLRQAAINQENRVKEFQKFLKKNPLAKSMLKINPGYTIYPLITTLHEEDVIKENNTIFIPAWKLNKFLIEAEQYI